ncbi:hypothetical protein pdam_00025012 [Pocillopora damicornis]|uniref:Uncharacterized protein n=1 Tax=Pocillopora damicornis TaxID=46731 RepID=A0A3M6V342_POCDA|nr:hypothetical protein pdam_00025012 [Pocillopora damicornis]
MTEIIREIRIKTACAKNKTNKMRSNPTKAPTRSQRKIMSACTRLNVTTRLYLRPIDSARSLSTLIAVDVKTEIPQRKKLDTSLISKSFSLKYIISSRRSVTVNSGCVIFPTKRSVTAKHRNKITLCRARRIRKLPNDAVIDKTTFKNIHPAKATSRTQKEIISARTRLNVTTILYLRPNDNARSLSTLIAVDVKRETPQRTTEEACCMPTTYS